MIIKFCFQNEIHRCSDPPSDFSLLHPFLIKMFQSNLPGKFVLSYMSPEGESFPLSSHEDYEALKNKRFNKPVKVVITEVQEEIEKIEDDVSEYDMIADSEKADNLEPEDIVEDKQEVAPEEPEELQRSEIEVSERKELRDLLEEITEEVTKIHVVPKIQKLEGEVTQEDQVKKIVREALIEQLPFIMERLRTGSMQESMRSVQSDYNVDLSEQKKYNWNQMALYPYYQSILQSIPDEIKVAQSEAQESQEERNIYLPEIAKEEGAKVEEEKVGERSPSLLKKVQKAFVEFPGKAANFVDNLTHKMSGDPYVICEEGKYPKSVVEKVEELKEVFAEADKKELLDFVSKLPKEFPLFQCGDLFAMHKNMD